MMTPRLLTHRGETRSMKAWSRHLGIPYKRIETRLRRGLSVGEALAPANGHEVRSDRVAEGRRMWRSGHTVAEICAVLGVTRHAVYYYKSLER